MHRQRVAAAVLAGLGLLVTGVAIGAALVGRASPDALLASNYGTAFDDADTSWTSLPPNVWLSGLGSIGRAAPDKTISEGDTITIAGKDGHPDVIRVTALELIDGERFGVPGVRFQLVTGRSTTGATSSVVRFMFATEAPTGLPIKAPADRVL